MVAVVFCIYNDCANDAGDLIQQGAIGRVVQVLRDPDLGEVALGAAVADEVERASVPAAVPGCETQGTVSWPRWCFFQTTVLKVDRPGVGFERASEDAVRQWQYRPATKDGVKVRMWIAVRIVFKIE